jgi:hypothetical protein
MAITPRTSEALSIKGLLSQRALSVRESTPKGQIYVKGKTFATVFPGTAKGGESKIRLIFARSFAMG